MTARRSIRRLMLAGTLTLSLACAGAARAGTDAPPWTLTASVEHRHDDNILQLTQHGFDRFDANSAAPRFLIRSTDDDIHILHGDARWRGRTFRRREARITASADVQRFARNGVKDWEEYDLGVVQELTASKRHLVTMETWASAIPSFYLGQLTDDDDSFAAGRTIRRPVTYRQLAWGVRMEQQLARGRVSVALGAERVRRDYDSHFDERDNHNDQWRIEALWRPFRRWDATFGLEYLAGGLRATGDLPSSPIRDDDISYDHRGLGANARLPWRVRGSRGRLDLTWTPERRDYTTPDKFDVLRYQRTNRRERLALAVTQRVWANLDLVADYDRLTSRARFPDGLLVDPDVTDFEQHRFGVRLRGRWDLPGR
jgi:hypothetical protein